MHLEMSMNVAVTFCTESCNIGIHICINKYEFLNFAHCVLARKYDAAGKGLATQGYLLSCIIQFIISSFRNCLACFKTH